MIIPNKKKACTEWIDCTLLAAPLVQQYAKTGLFTNQYKRNRVKWDGINEIYR